jgi:hypothetical protein
MANRRKEIEPTMKKTVLLVFMTSQCALAQEAVNVAHYQINDSAGAIAFGGITIAGGPPVPGAPYAATITNKFTQSLADGTVLSQTSTGSTARDSEGRTREDAPKPTVGDPSVHPPQLVFVQDPVAHVSYVFDLANKTAQKAPLPPSGPGGGPAVQVRTAFAQADPAIDEVPEGPMVVSTRGVLPNEHVHSESLGSQTMEGLQVNGVRTTQTIPAGEIGNAKPILIVSEVWTSPELKTVIYSKLSDPRTGEHVFELTNIVRSDPDPSLFVVPPDFQMVDDSGPVSFDPKE